MQAGVRDATRFRPQQGRFQLASRRVGLRFGSAGWWLRFTPGRRCQESAPHDLNAARDGRMLIVMPLPGR